MKSGTQLKLFIVDDDHFSATVYEQYLKNNDFKDVTYFDNGDDCLENLYQKPDIIFLDYNMENLNGFEVLKRIKRHDPNIYVVMVSGQENINTAVDALKHGAFDYLMKDAKVCEKMSETISRIIKIQIEIDKTHKGGFFRFLSVF